MHFLVFGRPSLNDLGEKVEKAFESFRLVVTGCFQIKSFLAKIFFLRVENTFLFFVSLDWKITN